MLMHDAKRTGYSSLMLFSRSRLLTVACLLFLISVLYYLTNIESSLHWRLGLENHAGSEQSSLALRLSPESHINREPKTINLEWKITKGQRRPDGVLKDVYLINGQFPGPLIEARSGDNVVVAIHNALKDEGLAIHWHGLWMQGANEMDGAVGLTQCPISPSKTFTYKFKIHDDQAGTFWYHSHSELQRVDGLYGGIFIHKPSVSGVSDLQVLDYDQEFGLLIGDWYHRPSNEVQDYYKDFSNAGNEPAPDSLVINGQGYFNCSMAVPAHPLSCTIVAVPQMKLQSSRTRLRIVNTGAMTGYTIAVIGYNLYLVQVDGGNDVSQAPGAASIGILYPGERMDIIIERSHQFDERTAALRIELDSENLKFRNFALTEIQDFPIRTAENSSAVAMAADTSTVSFPPFDLAKSTGPPRSATGMPDKADESLVLYTKIEILGEFNNAPRGFINQSSWDMQASRDLPLLALNRADWRGSLVPYIKSGSDRWVDIVLNNFDDRGHPFHLHGNDFFILAIHEAGIGGYDEAFNPFDTSKPPAGGPLNVAHPVRKDTVFVPAMGYVVLRFNSKNEGLWFFHCHILWHQAVGMAMALHVGSEGNGLLKSEVDISNVGQLCNID